MKIPESIRVNTGDQQEVYNTIDRFFQDVRTETGKKLPNCHELDFEIRLRGVMYESSPTPVPSDDMIHMLLYKERVIAVVTETRTEGNYIQFDFFK